jgi:hypothetical protein
MVMDNQASALQPPILEEVIVIAHKCEHKINRGAALVFLAASVLTYHVFVNQFFIGLTAFRVSRGRRANRRFRRGARRSFAPRQPMTRPPPQSPQRLRPRARPLPGRRCAQHGRPLDPQTLPRRA